MSINFHPSFKPFLYLLTLFEIAVRMDNWRGRDWGEKQNNAHRVRSKHWKSSLFSVVFMCLISPTQKFKLEKITLNTED